MKKFLCMALSLLMLLPVVAALPITASATDATPSGQIWEGEYDLRNYTGNAVVSSNNDTMYAQGYDKDIAKYNNETNYPNSERPSMDGHAMWKAAGVGNWIEFTLDVKTSGEKHVYLQAINAVDFAQFKVTLRKNGVDATNATVLAEKIDQYSSSGKFVEYDLNTVTVEPGKYILRFECVGKNDNMTKTDYILSIDYFELVGNDGIRRTQKIGQRNDTYGTSYVFEDGTIRYEGESMTWTNSTSATTAVQNYCGHSAAVSHTRHYWTNGGTVAVGDTFSFNFMVPESGEYLIAQNSVIASNYGEFQFQIDGVDIGDPVVLTQTTNIPYTQKSTGNKYSTLGTVMLDAGLHTITAVAKTALKFSFDCLDIKKVGEYAPSGQIWEGETDLRNLYYTQTEKHNDFYGQDITSYNTNENSPTKPSMDAHAIWKNVALNDEMTFTLTSETSGTKTLYIRFLHAVDFGKFDIIWNGQKLGKTVDMYAAKPYYLEDKAIGTVTVEKGKSYTLTFKSVGTSNTAYNMSIDFIELVGEDGIRRAQDINARTNAYGILDVLDDGTIRYEAEGLTANNHDIYLGHTAVTNYRTHVKKELGELGESLSLTFNVPDAGIYKLKGINGVVNTDYGTFAVTINSKAMGTYDLYNKTKYGNSSISSRYVAFDDASILLNAGANTITFTAVETQATKNMLSVDYFDIQKVDGYANITERKLSVGQDLAITYYATIDSEMVENYTPAMVFSMKNTKGEDASETVLASNYTPNIHRQNHSFRFEHIAPQLIGEDINVSLVLVDELGAVVKTLDTYTDSIKKYLVSLATSNDATTELKTLVSDMLVYGQASKEYLNATAIKDVIDDTITASAWFAASETAIPSTKMEKSTSTGNSKFTTAGVRVDNINKLYFVFTADADKTVTVKVGGKTLEAINMGNGSYIVYTDGISAIKQDTKVTAELQENGVTVQTLKISINDYAYAMKDDAKAGAVVTALYRYGASAVAYVSSAN